jgi:sigma-B regulation protein RsbU (phosphoserine phosphatase)
MVRLLQDVDGAIERLNGGRYGDCEVCGEWVGDDLLAGNPMARYCLCDLTPERQALLEEDLSLAGHIQTGLLPKQNFSHAGWTTHYRYLPHGPVSGDYIDLVARDGREETLYFMMGDVSGKGVAASLLMAHLNALVRSLIDRGLPLEELVEQANRTFLHSTDSLHYATLVAGRARRSGEVEICNAGHWPPLLVREGSVTALDSGNFPVGLIDSHAYGVHRLELGPGEMLVLYTDGLVEALDAGGEEYGMTSLLRVLERNRDRDPALLLDAVLQDLGRFRGGRRPEDDLSLLAIRRE